MPTYRLTLAYRGAAYAGWQRQENALACSRWWKRLWSDCSASPCG